MQEQRKQQRQQERQRQRQRPRQRQRHRQRQQQRQPATMAFCLHMDLFLSHLHGELSCTPQCSPQVGLHCAWNEAHMYQTEKMSSQPVQSWPRAVAKQQLQPHMLHPTNCHTWHHWLAARTDKHSQRKSRRCQSLTHEGPRSFNFK